MEKAKIFLQTIISSEIVIGIFIGVITPVILLKKNIIADDGQAIIIGILISISGFLYKTFSTFNSLNKKIEPIGDFINDKNNQSSNKHYISSKLDNINEKLSAIIGRYGTNKNDLFILFFDKILDDISNNLTDVIQYEKFIIDGNLIMYVDRINEIFSGKDTDIFYAICDISTIEYFKSAHGKIFFKSMDEAVNESRLNSIKRLFIYRSTDDLNNRTFIDFYSFHSNHPGYEPAIMSYEDFCEIAKGFQIKEFSFDFGIYGEHFVWETIGDMINIQEGAFNRDTRRIEEYKKLFDRLWYKARMESFKLELDPSLDSIDILFQKFNE